METTHSLVGAESAISISISTAASSSLALRRVAVRARVPPTRGAPRPCDCACQRDAAGWSACRVQQTDFVFDTMNLNSCAALRQACAARKFKNRNLSSCRRTLPFPPLNCQLVCASASSRWTPSPCRDSCARRLSRHLPVEAVACRDRRAARRPRCHSPRPRPRRLATWSTRLVPRPPPAAPSFARAPVRVSQHHQLQYRYRRRR